MADENRLGAALAAHLALRGWTQGDLCVAAAVNKNTVSDIITGRTQAPSVRTLNKIEDALGLTRGTLAAHGEDVPVAVFGEARFGQARFARDLSDVSETELLAELTHRIKNYERAVFELTPLADAEKERQKARSAYLASIDDGDREGVWIKHQWDRLQFEASGEGSGWSAEDRDVHAHLCAMIDALVFQRATNAEAEKSPSQNGDPADEAAPPPVRLLSAREAMAAKRQRLLEDAQLQDEAAVAQMPILHSLPAHRTYEGNAFALAVGGDSVTECHIAACGCTDDYS